MTSSFSDDFRGTLFLAPASGENLESTVRKSVYLKDIESRLDLATLTKLRAILSESSSFRCWAMTSPRRSFFNKMRAGDLVLFTPRGTGRFKYQARVSAKLESQPLGDLLWTVVPGKPWSLIYFLEDVKSVEIGKQRLIAELGYNPTFDVPGITPVDSSKLRAAIVRHGSLEGLLAAAAVRS